MLITAGLFRQFWAQKFGRDPIQTNPWVNSTHVHLCCAILRSQPTKH